MIRPAALISKPAKFPRGEDEQLFREERRRYRQRLRETSAALLPGERVTLCGRFPRRNRDGEAVIAIKLAESGAFWGGWQVKPAGRFKVCWRGFARLDWFEAFEFGCEVALAAENVTLLWDEVDVTLGPYIHRSKYAKTAIHAGRHRGVAIVACARRAAEVPRILTANASRLLIFQTTEPADVKALRIRVGAAAADLIPTLKARACLDWRADTGVVGVVENASL